MEEFKEISDINVLIGYLEEASMALNKASALYRKLGYMNIHDHLRKQMKELDIFIKPLYLLIVEKIKERMKI